METHQLVGRARGRSTSRDSTSSSSSDSSVAPCPGRGTMMPPPELSSRKTRPVNFTMSRDQVLHLASAKDRKYVTARMNETITEHVNGIALSGYKILKIEKIDNPKINNQFDRIKPRIEREMGRPSEVWEAFHGSPYAEKIAMNGFDTSHSSPKNMFGKGIYVAPNSSKSTQYSWGNNGRCNNHSRRSCVKCTRTILLCICLMGNQYKPTQAISKVPHEYHSVVAEPSPDSALGLILNHPEYVLLNGHQVKPVFLIHFKIVARKHSQGVYKSLKSAIISMKSPLHLEYYKVGATPSTTISLEGPNTMMRSELSSLHTRPVNLTSKRGVTGEEIELMSNYFRLCKVTDCVLYQYHVDFEPEEDRPYARKAMLKKQGIQGGYLFDGMILYSAELFKLQPMELTTTLEDGKFGQIKITLTRQVNRGDHEYLQFFNVLMRKCLNFLDLQLVGCNFFDPHAKIDMGKFNMELWPGYQASIREHEHDILMCTRITHKVMRTDTMLDFLYDAQKRSKGGDWQVNFKDAILGQIVLTDYNNRTYKIDDVDFTVSPSSQFDMKGQGPISYADYYLERYNKEIRHKNQPLLISKSKSKEMRAGRPVSVYLVPELCRRTGLTDDEMRGNFKLMSAMAKHTRVEPSQLINKLNDFSRRLRGEKKIVDELSMWRMKVDDQLVRFKGRVLPLENIIQGSASNEQRYSAGPKVDWTQNVKCSQQLTAQTMPCWVVMVPRTMKSDTCKFVDALIDAAKKMGLNMGMPEFRNIKNDHPETYVNALEAMMEEPRDLPPSLVLCAVTNNSSDRYSAIKNKCCIDKPVPTQVVTQRAMTNKNLASIASKVAIQINCKVGGAPWSVEMPMKGTMFVGFDVSHDTMNKSLSFGSLVASLNDSVSRFFSTVTAHKTGEELSNGISLNLVKALRKYKKVNENSLPSRIVIYRDGVGDGQIPYVCKHEIPMIKKKLTEVYGSEMWRMAFLIVSKRINTRIFTANGNRPPPGTVVDDCITLPERYDFFLVSQSVTQGSVSPTSYNVISDNTGLEPDMMQRLAYKLTHCYFNWSGAVRVPAPVQYAHKLAALCSMFLHSPPSKKLEDLLHFL